MHSRLFADINQNEHEALEYALGTTKFWLHLFLLLVAVELVAKLPRTERGYIRQTFSRRFLKQLRTWAGSIRQSGEVKTSNLLRAHQWRSDIPGNHRLLLGIKKDTVDEGLLPFLTRFEVRAPGPIGLERCTHVEVPLKHVGEVKKLLRERRVSLPVIPLEFGELYLSGRPLRDLVYA